MGSFAKSLSTRSNNFLDGNGCSWSKNGLTRIDARSQGILQNTFDVGILWHSSCTVSLGPVLYIYLAFERTLVSCWLLHASKNAYISQLSHPNKKIDWWAFCGWSHSTSFWDKPTIIFDMYTLTAIMVCSVSPSSSQSASNLDVAKNTIVFRLHRPDSAHYIFSLMCLVNQALAWAENRWWQQRQLINRNTDNSSSGITKSSVAITIICSQDVGINIMQWRSNP